jgi:SAM-dependent methyltransferase
MTITVPDEAHARFVELLYRTVLRREPDPSGRATVLAMLQQGACVTDLLAGALASPEFLSTRLVPAHALVGDGYDPANDPHMQSFATPAVRARSDTLAAAQPIDRATFDAVVARAVERFHAELAGFADQDSYLATHFERFYEIANLVTTLLDERGLRAGNVLDVGFSVNTMILQFLLPDAVVSVCDRFGGALPPSLSGESFLADLAASDLQDLDLGYRADVIIFAEVLEHLLANPVRVLSFLIRHLAEGGRLVLTTPNFFRRELLDRIRWQINPQPILPMESMSDDVPHFHVREYAMKELLIFAEQAGGRIEAFFYSSCWDSAADRDQLPPHEWSNMVVVIGRA